MIRSLAIPPFKKKGVHLEEVDAVILKMNYLEEFIIKVEHSSYVLQLENNAPRRFRPLFTNQYR
jgi:hypothetical protein